MQRNQIKSEVKRYIFKKMKALDSSTLLCRLTAYLDRYHKEKDVAVVNVVFFEYVNIY